MSRGLETPLPRQSLTRNPSAVRGDRQDRTLPVPHPLRRPPSQAGSEAARPARFVDDVWLPSAQFGQDAHFGGTNFSGDAWFHGVAFNGYATFEKAAFTGDIRFDEATLDGMPYEPPELNPRDLDYFGE
ncbi:pentapeptide repeat-containing protein [Amycolatopsis rhizosphaerae]|uniref:pentapeptide repeat-containing protein n=1 Tax=Amycolatopsis rhizosphaerae TaxID=2053003 RepID=UPI003CCC723A